MTAASTPLVTNASRPSSGAPGAGRGWSMTPGSAGSIAAISRQLSAPREPMGEHVIRNMLAGYALVDHLVASGAIPATETCPPRSVHAMRGCSSLGRAVPAVGVHA